MKDIQVYKPPIIGLLSSGNELVSCDSESLPDGTIRDSNKAMMMAMLRKVSAQADIRDFGTMVDTSDDIHSKM